MHYNKNITQRSIRYVGCNIWNELPSKIKQDERKSLSIFTKKVKNLLRIEQLSN